MHEITVILTTYNCGHYLSESIDSIINQTFKKWILIIVDDGSTDQTNEILKRYRIIMKDKLIVIKNRKNLGINFSFNKALKMIKTPFFARQDADDISNINRLKISYDFLKKNDDYDFVSSKMESLFDKNLIFPKNFIKKPTIGDFIKGLPFCNAPILYRTSILKKLNGYSTDSKFTKRYEDYEFLFRCYQFGLKGFNLDIISYYVRQNLDYSKKIKLSDRFTEFKLKLYIYEKVNLSFPKFIYIIIPLLKMILPSFVYRLYFKLIK